jgi:hypothetical protein
MRNKILRISNEEVISAFSTGVSDVKMREKLSVNDELTSVVRLFEIADRCTKAEEGRLFVHNLPGALPPKPKSKDPKRKEAAILAAEPDHKQHRGDRSERDKGRRRRYCIIHTKDTHNTEDCWIVRKFHVDPGAIATTTTARKVAAARVCLEPILSRCRCPHQQTIIERRTRGLSRAVRLRRLPPGWGSGSSVKLTLQAAIARDRGGAAQCRQSSDEVVDVQDWLR